jgi:hypothetical protein
MLTFKGIYSDILHGIALTLTSHDVNELCRISL